LQELEANLYKQAKKYMIDFPLKKPINVIADSWNQLFKEGKDPFTYGLNYGWLEKYMDIKKLYNYNYVPTNFKIGLFAHAGFGSVEETFLLQDAFSTLVKTEYDYNLLEKYRKIDNETYKKISDLKFEVCSYSRLTIISFFSFIECFINSMGHSYLERNQKSLTVHDTMTLKGLKKNNYLSLKSKIEKFQMIIREDKLIKIKTLDTKQIKEPFLSFFNMFEEIRNSSVHYSPEKEAIWMKPNEWVQKANEFAKLAIQVGVEFWNVCYDELGNPDYLGRFEFERLYKEAENRLVSRNKIEKEVLNREKI
jgi:hypothetical protein